MAKEKKEWQEISEFSTIAQKLIDKYPEKFAGVDSQYIVCYGVINKDKPATCNKRFSIASGKEPECFTNTKRVFVTFFQSDWDQKTDEQKLWLVYDALRHIDAGEEPWKILSPDYVDRGEMVRTLGPDWSEKESLPNPLTDKINFRD